jgi:ATP adenylyltransferase
MTTRKIKVKIESMDRLWAPWRNAYILQAQKNENRCIFCELPEENEDEKNFIVRRGKTAFVILNIFPYNNGHLMVAPYRHIARISSLKKEESLEMMELLAQAETTLRKTMKAENFNLGMNLGRAAGAGFDAHLHFHLVPRWNGDTNFMPVISDTKVISQSLEEVYKLLSANWAKKVKD